MPKIGRESFTIKNVYTNLEIWYSSKQGFFFKDIPEEVLAITKFNEIRFEKEGDLINSFRCALTEYHEQITKQRKVIIYRLFGSCEMVMNKSSDSSYTGTKSGVSKKFTTPDGCNNIQYLFGFTYNVLMECSGRTVEFYNIKDNGEVSKVPYRREVCRNEHVIDWTPEREKFFSDLKDNLQNLIGMVSTFFDQDNLLELMDSGMGRMLGSGNTAAIKEPNKIDINDIDDYLKVLCEVRKVGGLESQWYHKHCKSLSDISLYGIEKYLLKGVKEGLLLNDWDDTGNIETFYITEKGIEETNKYFK